MIEKQITDLLSIQYEKRVLVLDVHGFRSIYDYTKLLIEQQFEVLQYEDVELFRLYYEQNIKKSDSKWAVIVSEDMYVPYDIRKKFFETEISIKRLFPKLHEDTLLRYIKDIDLICYAYGDLYSSCDSKVKTVRFIEEEVFSKKNIADYCGEIVSTILPIRDAIEITSNEWITIARKKAVVEYYVAKANLFIDLSYIDNAFEKFVLGDYQKLSGQTSKMVPAILPKVMDFVAGGKTALIVMDGMSLFDFEVISRYFEGIDYDYQCTYALIPTTTAISRQSLLSGKYPRQLENPFNLSKEEKGFLDNAIDSGYAPQQCLYSRGYKPNIGLFTKITAIIINDIDDMVHGQRQGRKGMYSGLGLMAQKGDLQLLIKKLYSQGFDVYITSDHGNTPCVGVGSIHNAGVEVETKAKRMFVLKKFAEEKVAYSDKIIEYPGYYLDKNYRYFVCKSGISFDNQNEEVMTHGGISIDEVIVPFIKIRTVE